MTFDIIRTQHAPAAGGPCSQGVRFGELILTSLQTALDPQTGRVQGQDHAEQMHRCLCHLQAILEAAGSSLAGALKVTVYLTDLAALEAVDKVYADFFPVDSPARTVIAVSELPGGALAAVEAVAVRH
ncbi:MAG: Rid family detoxifying hydrolase [Candidatus Krumholzibacteria bacterium]|nr:Rid family detoxifying hydrolase [Candidatus Krumholzibacteria bacterium]